MITSVLTSHPLRYSALLKDVKWVRAERGNTILRAMIIFLINFPWFAVLVHLVRACVCVGMNSWVGRREWLEDRKENAKHYNVSQHDSERRQGWVGMNR